MPFRVPSGDLPACSCSSQTCGHHIHLCQSAAHGAFIRNTHTTTHTATHTQQHKQHTKHTTAHTHTHTDTETDTDTDTDTHTHTHTHMSTYTHTSHLISFFPITAAVSLS